MNKKIPSAFTLILLMAALLLTACNTPAAEPTLDNASIIATSIQQTMQSVQGTQAAQATPTTGATATSPVIGTGAPTIAIVSPPTAIPSPMSTNCLVAGLVSETIPDNSLVPKGVKFTKTWRVINGGTCAWSTAYKFVFVSGYDLGATKEIKIPENVPPGGITNISLEMTAPTSDGTYIGNWMLTTDTGVKIGDFYVQIYVGTPTVAPYKVTTVTTNAANQNPDPCPFQYIFNVTITTNGPGFVSFYYTDSMYPGQKFGGNQHDFGAAGTVTLQNTINFTASGDHTMTVYIDKPNYQPFGNVFTVKCP